MTPDALPWWVALPAGLLLMVGGLLAVIGALGLLRLPDFFARIHPPAMGSTLGTGCVLVASMLASSALLHRPVVHELLITLFVVLTAPVTSMILMRAAVSRAQASADAPREQSGPS